MKSPLLIVSSVISVLPIIEVLLRAIFIVVDFTMFISSSFSDEYATAFSFLFLFIPQMFAFALTIPAIILIPVSLVCIRVAYISYSTNKKSWTVLYLILFALICFSGNILQIPQAILRGDDSITLLWLFFIAAPLRIAAYFTQKKLNDID